MALYKLYYTPGLIIRTSDGLQFLTVDGNWAYEQYKEWLSAGNTPDPADPPPPTDPAQDANKTAAQTLINQYAAMLTNLSAIQAGTAALKARAATLSTITLSGSLAATQSQLQTVLRNLGTDIGTLEDNIQALSVNEERILKALKVFVQSQQ